MARFSTISIIYNPNSTGSSKKKAHALAKQLRNTGLKDAVKIIPTQHAGHAEQLAFKLAKGSRLPLIVSSSGDGGYNEVVNGVMKAKSDGFQAATGLLPAGNANDHYKNLHRGDIADQIAAGRVRKIDLLQITTTRGVTTGTRYAHSYIGIGLTPHIGKELNKVSLNRLNEKWIALKGLFKLSPVRLRVRGKIKMYDNIIFANIGSMSKVLSLSDTASPSDGKFELITFKHQKRSKLLRHLFMAATKGLRTTNRRTKYDFKTIESTSIQLDGEISTIAPGTHVQINIVPKALDCIV